MLGRDLDLMSAMPTMATTPPDNIRQLFAIQTASPTSQLHQTWAMRDLRARHIRLALVALAHQRLAEAVYQAVRQAQPSRMTTFTFLQQSHCYRHAAPVCSNNNKVWSGK